MLASGKRERAAPKNGPLTSVNSRRYFFLPHAFPITLLLMGTDIVKE